MSALTIGNHNSKFRAKKFPST